MLRVSNGGCMAHWPERGRSTSMTIMMTKTCDRARGATLAVVMLLTLGLLALAAPAGATPPQQEEFTQRLSGPHFLSGPCGVTIEQDGMMYGRVTRYEDGREHAHLRLDLSLTSNGQTAREQPSFNVMIDPDAGTIELSGTVVNVHAAGSGSLLKEVGHQVRDLESRDLVRIAGRWDVIEGDFGRVCSHFVGE